MRRNIAAITALLGLTAAAPARAEDVAAAEALFRRGLEGMEAGRWPEACSALAESQRLDPRLGTLFTLAECRAKEGKIATAVALYEDYLSAFSRLTPAEQARQRARQKIAGDKKRSLGPHVPRLVLRLPSGVSASVTRDDVALRPPALGIPLPVDPGEHEVTTRVDRGGVRRQVITIGLDEEKVVDLEVVTAGGGAPAPDAPAPAPRGGRPPPAAGDGSRRPFAFAALGLGAAGVVVGAATGAAVLVKRGAVVSGCVDRRCTAAGLDAANTAKTLGNVSTAAFAVGGAALAAAVVLFVTDRPAAPAAAAARWQLTAGNLDGKGAFAGVRGEW